MIFYFENNMGDFGVFTEDDILMAIYSAWNIEANLFIVTDIKNINSKTMKLIFAPFEDNDFNSELLEEYGYYIVDGSWEREIRSCKTDEIVKYDWSEVRTLN
jgi:lysophospholipid acyltransferase (LPLAT)-like uncharacterized protein